MRQHLDHLTHLVLLRRKRRMQQRMLLIANKQKRQDFLPFLLLSIPSFLLLILTVRRSLRSWRALLFSQTRFIQLVYPVAIYN